MSTVERHRVDLRADYLALSRVMEFDHVVRVHPDGTVSADLDTYAPDLHEDQGEPLLDGDEWRLMDGWSGQDRYAGPLMHASEFIGGGMARAILATPGRYVALVSYPLDDDEPESWAVAFITDDGSTP